VPAQRSHDPASTELDSAIAPTAFYAQPSAASLNSTVYATSLLSTAVAAEHHTSLAAPWALAVPGDSAAVTATVSGPVAGVPSASVYSGDYGCDGGGLPAMWFEPSFLDQLAELLQPGAAAADWPGNGHAAPASIFCSQLTDADRELFSNTVLPGDFDPTTTTHHYNDNDNGGGGGYQSPTTEEVLLDSGVVARASHLLPPPPPVAVLRKQAERARNKRRRKHKSLRHALQELTESEHDDDSSSSSDSDSSDDSYGVSSAPPPAPIRRRKQRPAVAVHDDDSDASDAPPKAKSRTKNSAQKDKYETHTKYVYGLKSIHQMRARLHRELALAQSRSDVVGYEKAVRKLIVKCELALTAREKVRALIAQPGASFSAAQLKAIAEAEGDFDGRRLNKLNRYNRSVPERTAVKQAVAAEFRARNRQHAQQQQ
jgi:hypothetical protein